MSSATPFVTGNANKLKEVKSILLSGDKPVEITSQALDIPEEQGTTQEVAIAKCRRAAEMLNGPCITEDTALWTEPVLFEGRTDGDIVRAKGPPVFGWDATFRPKGETLTYAEMPAEYKNKLSHRYKALEKLREFLTFSSS
ncbi:inosine triphosphate pyrophosphatase-like protein [Flagelloscypha sp. PMI_526]|nr:inosine triphosphate pyrophosphatase-like protein [Flagelloscypha sp. PMI_526]